jgi:hypothetical protein
MPNTPNTHVTVYTEPDAVTDKYGKVYVYDSSTGEIIGELTPEVAELIRHHTAGTLHYDGATISAHTNDPPTDGTDPAMTAEPTTACDVQPCRTGPAHVVLFAVAGPFHGVTYRPGQRIYACLLHGGQIVDARKHPDKAPAWLQPDLDQLPRPNLPDHYPTAPARPQPWKAPIRERRVHTAP